MPSLSFILASFVVESCLIIHRSWFYFLDTATSEETVKAVEMPWKNQLDPIRL